MLLFVGIFTHVFKDTIRSSLLKEESGSGRIKTYGSDPVHSLKFAHYLVSLDKKDRIRIRTRSFRIQNTAYSAYLLSAK